MFKRTMIVVLDSAGIGALPDAASYGDSGVNTIGHLAEAVGGLKVPTMQSMGLGCIAPISGVSCPTDVKGGYAKMAEISQCKDTTGGHWEIAGCPAEQPFPYYPEGFPAEVIEKFMALTGAKGVLGNKPASGTEIIMELGDEHVRTGYPIVYTSADSVFQIAAHEDVIPLKKLYEMCDIARNQVCVGKHAVGRIIARPFIGKSGAYQRTANRHDYSLLPPMDTMLDRLKAQGIATVSVGKISDIFAGRGVSESNPTKSNDEGMNVLARMVNSGIDKGLIFVNLVEFDMVYGHRRNPQGYAEALERFDSQLAALLPQMREDDLLFITADHGCDPTHTGTDHTREYVPLLVWHKNIGRVDLGQRKSFSDISATILDNFAVEPLKFGTSFLREVK